MTTLYNSTNRELLKKAFIEAQTKRFESIPSDENNELVFADGFYEKTVSLVNRKTSILYKCFNTKAKKAAAIAAVLLILSGSIMTVEAIRVPVLEFVEKTYKNCVEFFTSKSTEDEQENTTESETEEVSRENDAEKLDTAVISTEEKDTSKYESTLKETVTDEQTEYNEIAPESEVSEKEGEEPFVPVFSVTKEGHYGIWYDNTAWEFNETTGTLTISGKGDIYGKSHRVNNYPWAKLNVKEVIINEGITGIPYNAFSSFNNLSKVSIPDSIRRVADSALPIGETNNLPLKYNVYGGEDEKTQSWYLGNEKNPYLVLISANVDTSIGLNFHPDTKVIASGAVWAYKLGSIEFPEGLVSICESSLMLSGFQGGELIIPDSLEYIANNPFGTVSNFEKLTGFTVSENNKYFKSVNGDLYSKDGKELLFLVSSSENGILSIPEGVVTIRSNNITTDRLGLVKELYIPASLDSACVDYLMEECSGAKIYFSGASKDYSSINGNLYTSDGTVLLCLNSIPEDGRLTIPDGVKGIGQNISSVFAKYKKGTRIKSLNIPSTYESDDLSDILSYFIVEESVSIAVGNNKYCTRDGMVFSLDGTVLFFGSIYDANTSTVSVPYGVISIDACVFSNLYAKYGTQIQNGNRIDVKALIIPSIISEASISTIKHIFNITESVNVFYSEGIQTYSSIDGILCSSDGTRMIFCPQSNTNLHEEYTVPDSVKRIDRACFEGCITLKKIVISNSVEVLAHGAFEDCTNLEEVVLGNGLTYIDSRGCIFAGCSKLTRITIPFDSDNTVSYRSLLSLDMFKEIDFGGNEYQLSLLPDFQAYLYKNPATVVHLAPDGDINHDGELGTDDLMLAELYLNGELSDEAVREMNLNIWAFDMDHDEDLDEDDILLMKTALED